MTEWVVRLVARIPVPIHAKLLTAFLAIVVLLIATGAEGLHVLAGRTGGPRSWSSSSERSPPIASSSTTRRRSSTG